MKLKGKRAIVTGASRGLGAKIAEVFEREGAEVFKPTREEYDMSWEDSPDRILRNAWNGIAPEIIVNNAAQIGPIGPADETYYLDWEECLKVNLIYPAEICRLAVGMMKREKAQGSIINISGGGATSPRPNYSAYATAKCGLVRFSETLAAEVEQYGIRVNCVAPGLLNTRMGSPDGDPPDRAAELVAWLASDDSRPITGRLISAKWDAWDQPGFAEYLSKEGARDMYKLRRIQPE